MDAELAAERWVRLELHLDALRSLADALRHTRARLIVIKGMHLCLVAERDPLDRAFTDLDVVVAEVAYDVAIEALRRAGWRIRRDDWSASTVFDREGRTVDLHRRPLPTFVGRLDAHRLSSRALARPDLFQREVYVPDVLDAAVIAIGHHVKDKLGGHRHVRHARDLRTLSERAGLTPERLAERLVEHGLRRAGLVSLQALTMDDPWFSAWFEALSPSNAERRWAHWMADVLRAPLPLQRMAQFALARTIGDSALEILANLVCGISVRAPWIALEHAARLWPSLRYL